MTKLSSGAGRRANSFCRSMGVDTPRSIASSPSKGCHIWNTALAYSSVCKSPLTTWLMQACNSAASASTCTYRRKNDGYRAFATSSSSPPGAPAPAPPPRSGPRRIRPAPPTAPASAPRPPAAASSDVRSSAGTARWSPAPPRPHPLPRPCPPRSLGVAQPLSVTGGYARASTGAVSGQVASCG